MTNVVVKAENVQSAIDLYQNDFTLIQWKTAMPATRKTKMEVVEGAKIVHWMTRLALQPLNRK